MEGPAFVEAAVEAGATVVELFAGPNSPDVAAGPAPTAVSSAVLDKIAGTKSPRGPVAVVAIPEPRRLRRHDTVVLWDVADPGNAGAIVRSAAAFGFDVAVVGTTADVWSPKSIRAAAAAQFGLPVARLGADEAVGALRTAGLVTCAAVPTGGIELAAVGPEPVALIIGNEAHGLPDRVVAATDHCVTVGMSGRVESLNAAVSAGIMLYELGRR